MRSIVALAWCLVLAALPSAAQTCTFAINPPSANFTAAGGNDVIDITLTAGAGTCSRTATSNANWITISFGTPGTGNGTVGYTVQSNPFTAERSGTITVAGRTFTVNQAAGSCTYSISPSSASVAATGATGSFNMTAGLNSCPWTVASSAPDWLVVTSSASGSGNTTVRYSAGANPSTAARSATISIGGQSFTVNQAGICTFTLNPATASVTAAASTGSISVTASANSCAWNAASQNEWITLTSGASGTGNGTVGYSVAANTTGLDRTGSITIGTTGFTVFQPGSTCNFALSANGRSFPAEGGTGSFYVNGACPWTPLSNAEWISVTSGASTTGSGTVTYLVAGNTGTASRTGYINIGTRSYSIEQAGVPCSVTLGSQGTSSPATGTSGAINVVAGSGCAWVAATVAGWVTLTNPAGSGEGDVLYSVQANTTSQPRTAIVTIANQRFTIAQEAADCAFQLTPTQAVFAASGGSGVINVATVCSWSASATSNWITLGAGANQTGNGTLAYTVAANASNDARSGSIRIGGQSVAITQSGKDCSVAVSPAAIELPGRGGSAVVTVAGSKGCRWEPQKDSGWIVIPSWSAVDGSGTVTIRAAANPDAAPRYGAVLIAGRGVAVAQGGLEVSLARNGVLNAASFAAGPVAPGEIVTIFGSGLGPADLVKLALASDGLHLATKLAQTEVQFDGVAAPLIYVSESQISAVVPYSVGGKQSTQMRVLNQGVASEPMQLQVTPSSPAVFTIDASGRGQGAVLNQDNSVNSASNAAARNTIVQIFATGEGETNPPGEDGKIAGGEPLPRPRLNVTVTIGGQNAPVIYSGAAPGAVAGLFQVNVRVPQNVTPGAAVPVLVTVGQSRSQAGVTIAVR